MKRRGGVGATGTPGPRLGFREPIVIYWAAIFRRARAPATATWEGPLVVNAIRQRDLTHDLVLPTLLFAALGAMSWAVRGSTGFGGSAGCIFAGVLWGTAWWYIARDRSAEQSRRYASGWIVLAMTVGIGMAGARGWMQWPSFFEGKLQTNYAKGEFVPISRVYGFVWLFIAGMPWAGIGACLLAWCGPKRETRAWHWALRIGCGVGGAILGRALFDAYPELFLPLYDSLRDRYQDFENNPNLRRLINDSGSAIAHLGIYLGILAYEIGRRDGKNVVLILTVGVANGAGWALCQNWKWAPNLWPSANPNWWRCWESSGGISIGIAYGLAYFLVNRPMDDRERAAIRARRPLAGPNLEWLIVYLGMVAVPVLFVRAEIGPWGLAILGVLVLFGIGYFLRGPREGGGRESGSPTTPDPNLERWALYLTLLLGLGMSLRNALKGWMNLYWGREEYYSAQLWRVFGPVLLAGLVLLCLWILLRPLPRDWRGDPFPRATGIVWFVLLFQNVLAQIVTGPLSQWNEVAFSIYYVLLFGITAVIVVHYSAASSSRSVAARSPG